MANRERVPRPLLIATACCALVTVLVGVGAISLVSFGEWQMARENDASIPEKRAGALRTSREWARLAPYPVPDSALEIRIEGSDFTRQFTLKFTAPAGDVRRWMDASPGLRDVKPAEAPGGSLRFTIQPGGGAQSAEVVLSADGTQVIVDTWWS